ncbi:MAG TPA: Trx7/PDZ domain-containing (seleno)protein [Gemmataceae bacterium]|nr:Trx7/PDZ domain-containing (seleno)protein [Gemmataceae bacterium]
MCRSVILAVIVWLAVTGLVHAQSREEKVRADRQKVEAEGFWIYNDLPRGFAEARRTGKPLLVVLRCIPCEECVKLDDDLVNQDPRVRPLLEKFVCVRVVSANGLDLSLFQFDYDQSFAVFLLHADGTIYGRFGTRSHRTNWSDDVSIEGLAKALAGALELHREYPNNKAELAGKKGPAPEVPAPEKYPTLQGKYGSNLDFQGKVVQSCIHCHQIGDAQRQLYRNRREPIPEQVLFPHPHPKALGLILDPKERATVLRAEAGSPAGQAGFEKGDVIVRLGGQPLLSIADVQWVLHQAPAGEGSLKAEVQRGGRTLELTLPLPKGWRQRDDISWRVSTWGLRRMATGGLVLEDLTPDERKKAGLTETGMALRVKHVGQYGPHAAARNAGFRPGDIVVSFDDRTDFRREADLLAYALTRRKPGEKVAVTVLRDGQRINLTLPMQE